MNYSTTIESAKTLGEIQAMLARHGAKSILIEYEGGAPTGISFLIPTGFGDRGFRLPSSQENVWRALVQQQRAGKLQPRFVSKQQAARVAWRIVKDWIEAQLAMIEAGLVQVEQVLLPYMTTDDGQTFYEAMTERRLALPPARDAVLLEPHSCPESSKPMPNIETCPTCGAGAGCSATSFFGRSARVECRWSTAKATRNSGSTLHSVDR